ncbi:phage tail tube protein [Falsirhodobacter halotolerans]|uniref:phage tail tube protein n=1 Tax=Falsirhodobacter halotolerans TaxID=1146892 RepID=UPI001FD33ADD|nr:phage tail tube protein [Falsirhodobacter halotolerans]MCJ8138432.1 hypothetical protein [Falsirhodobacter halotolerans]
MLEIESQADIGYQDELWIGPFGDGQTPTAWTQILGVEELGMPEKTPEDVDVTHMQSPGRSRETRPGLMAVADFSQDIQFWPEHPSQVLLDDLAELTEAGEPAYVLIEMNVGGMRRTYRGYVNSFTPSGSVGDKRMASLAMKVFDRVANSRVPA